MIEREAFPRSAAGLVPTERADVGASAGSDDSPLGDEHRRFLDELCGADDEDDDRERSRRAAAHQHRFAGEEFAVDSSHNFHAVGEWA